MVKYPISLSLYLSNYILFLSIINIYILFIKGDILGQYLISKGADENARNNFGKLVWEGI
jgi:hypothetical protein